MTERLWCEKCRYWGAERAHQDDNPYGSCRVKAPIEGPLKALPYHDPDRPAEAGPIVLRGVWLWTAFDDWCGEHEPRDPKPIVAAPGGGRAS